MRAQKRPPFTLKALGVALNCQCIGPLLYVRFIFAMALAMLHSIFSLYAAYNLHLSSQTTGYVLANVGLLSVLMQGVGVGLVTKHFMKNAIIITSKRLMVFGLMG